MITPTVATHVVFGRLFCTNCTYIFWSYWVNNVNDGYSDFCCPNCNESDAQLDGAAHAVPFVRERRHHEFACEEAIEDLKTRRIHEWRNRES